MDGPPLGIFKLELMSQCRLGRVAGLQLENALQRGKEGHKYTIHDDIWFALQGILVVASNAAKLLWGSQGSAVEAERAPLRRAAGVTDGSPLKPRHVRNAFEHLDERIMDWHARGDTDVYAARQIGQDEHWPPEGGRLGHYNPITGEVAFLSHSVSIPDLLAELDRVYQNLRPK